ncbi:MAG: hydrogenase iron-sulfur subunit [Deltaproteobacteria bacterium]|nr:hydrogenase iron-sulfur subunit [Deltaproteobacteria bacterium]
MQYPPDIRVIRVMCTGRVDPALVADAFVHGADGVLVIGCYFGDCHYMQGNYMAKQKMDMAREMLEYAGMNPTRLQFRNLSSAEAANFAKYNTEFVGQIKELGPLGSGDKIGMPELKEELQIAQKSLAGPKLRWVVGKKPVFIDDARGNKYGEVFTEHEVNRTLSGIIIDEMATQSILAAIEKKPAAVKNLAKELEIPAPDALKYVLALKRRGFIEMDGVEGTSPVYKFKSAEGGRC